MARSYVASPHSDGIHELTVDLSGSPYYSRDMAPVPRAGRRWAPTDDLVAATNRTIVLRIAAATGL